MTSMENDFFLRPGVVNISLTDRCTATCTMCATNSNPDEWGAEIDVKRGLAWVDGVAKVQGPIGICFIGGEPFLRRDAMLALTERAHGHRLLVSVVSNCFWAQTAQAAQRVLEPLKEAGLTRITVSTDSFHRPFVTEQAVDNAIGAARKLGLRCNLNVVWGDASDAIPELLKRLKNSDYLDETSSFECLPVGRGVEIIPRSKPEMPDERCRLVISTLSIKSNGDVFACCGVGGFTPPLKVGNADRETIPELVERACRDPLLLALGLRGPQWLRSLTEGLLPPRPAGYVNYCHLCHELMTRPDCVHAMRHNLDGLAPLFMAEATVLARLSKAG